MWCEVVPPDIQHFRVRSSSNRLRPLEWVRYGSLQVFLGRCDAERVTTARPVVVQVHCDDDCGVTISFLVE